MAPPEDLALHLPEHCEAHDGAIEECSKGDDGKCDLVWCPSFRGKDKKDHKHG